MNYYFVSEVTHYLNISVNRCHKIESDTIPFYDLTFVASGSMTYIANGKLYTLKKGDALFLPPGTVRSRLEGTEPCKYISFNFYALPEVEFPFSPVIEKCLSTNIKMLISSFPQKHLINYYHSREKVANMLNFILFELMDIYTLKSSNVHIMDITRYVEDHITEQIGLNDISKSLNLSKEHVSYLFKREMGKTLTDYINERKMLLAKELILSREMSLNDIATHLGFSNYGYFSRLFKTHYGITPLRMKNEI